MSVYLKLFESNIKNMTKKEALLVFVTNIKGLSEFLSAEDTGSSKDTMYVWLAR